MRSTLTLSKPAARASSKARRASAAVWSRSSVGRTRVLEALDAQADPGHARRAIALEALARDALRVALHRDLGARLQGKARPERVENAGELGGGEERRRAAPEEDGGRTDAPRPGRGPRSRDLGVEGAQEARDGGLEIGRGIEGAVAAALGAEGNVDVDAEPCRPRRPPVQRRRSGRGAYGSQWPRRLQRSQWRSPFHDQ